MAIKMVKNYVFTKNSPWLEIRRYRCVPAWLLVCKHILSLTPCLNRLICKISNLDIYFPKHISTLRFYEDTFQSYTFL